MKRHVVKAYFIKFILIFSTILWTSADKEIHREVLFCKNRPLPIGLILRGEDIYLISRLWATQTPLG
ncbi:MAG: hypothetical protein ACXVHT_09505 [Methanobacterium sp.]